MTLALGVDDRQCALLDDRDMRAGMHVPAAGAARLKSDLHHQRVK